MQSLEADVRYIQALSTETDDLGIIQALNSWSTSRAIEALSAAYNDNVRMVRFMVLAGVKDEFILEILASVWGQVRAEAAIRAAWPPERFNKALGRDIISFVGNESYNPYSSGN
jgi:hypothetical protein